MRRARPRLGAPGWLAPMKGGTVTASDDLTGLLADIDRVFGIETVLSDYGKDLVEAYYAQSGPIYDRLHSVKGSMHMAITPPGAAFRPDDYRTHPRRAVAAAREVGAAKVLELGCGKGFNATVVARNLPGVAVLGTDLLPAHIARCRATAAEDGLANLTFEQADFQALPDHLTGFGVVYAFETLCYARDLDAVARGVARALTPGGQFLIYDVHKLRPLSECPAEMAQAVRLVEVATVLPQGFHPAGAWEAALTRAGLTIRTVTDHTPQVQPDQLHLQAMGLSLIGDWKRRLAVKAMPRYMARNLIAALLAPLIYAVPLNRHPGGPVAYQMILAEKPR